MSDAPTFVIQGEAMQRLRRKLGDAGRNPTLEVRVEDGGDMWSLRVLKTDGSVVAKDADDEDISNG